MTDRRGQTWEAGSGELWLVTASEPVPRRRRIKHSVLILESPVASLAGRASWVHEDDEFPWEWIRDMRRLGRLPRP